MRSESSDQPEGARAIGEQHKSSVDASMARPPWKQDLLCCDLRRWSSRGFCVSVGPICFEFGQGFVVFHQFSHCHPIPPGSSRVAGHHAAGRAPFARVLATSTSFFSLPPSQIRLRSDPPTTTSPFFSLPPPTSQIRLRSLRRRALPSHVSTPSVGGILPTVNALTRLTRPTTPSVPEVSRSSQEAPATRSRHGGAEVGANY